MVAGRDREEADRTHDAGVAELRLSGDDGVGDVVIDGLSPSSVTFYLHFSPSHIHATKTRMQGITYRVSLKLDLQLRSILEHPLNDIRIRGRSLDRHALLQGAPEAIEGFQLDQVPDGAEWRRDDG